MPSFPSSRRRPWPYDVEIDDSKLMLVPTQSGDMVASKSQPLESTPFTYEYSSTNPFLERVYPMTGLVAGLGQKVQGDSLTRFQPVDTPRRYYYAMGVDLSLNGFRVRAPAGGTETVDAGNSVISLEVGLHGGVATLFAATATGVKRQTAGGTWVASLTSATPPRQFCRFKGAGAGAVDALYLATSASNLYRYDGATWTVAGAGAGPPGNLAQAICRIQNEFWVGWGNQVAKVEFDPMVRADYAAPITVGDGSDTINWLVQNKNQLYVMRGDGIFTVTSAGIDQELYPSLRFTPSSDNGRHATVWLDSLWVPWSDGFYQIQPDATLSPEGLEQLLENDSEVSGHIVATAGHNEWFNYEVLYNPLSAASYLLKYGTWSDSESRNVGRASDFLPVHNGSLVKWAKQTTCCRFVPKAVHGGSYDRLYVGFTDGTVEWVHLPTGAPNPTTDTAFPFAAGDGYVYWPEHHGGFRADNKVFYGFSVYAPTLSPTNSYRVEVRADRLAGWTALRIKNSDGTLSTFDFTVSGQRQDFPDEDRPVAKALQIREVMHRVSGTGTAVVETVAVHEQVRPSVRVENEMTIDLGLAVARRDGNVTRQRPDDLRAKLRTAVASPSPVVVMLPDGEIEVMSVIDYHEALKAKKGRKGLEWLGQAKMVQFKALSASVAAQGLSYGTLENYTYGQLEVLLS